ncbi:MAG: NADH-quinone oxidoreductase subunit M [Verrucomicrobiota bacterium]
MLFFLTLVPLLAAIVILLGAPARLTALTGGALAFGVSLLLYARFNPVVSGFQFVTSVPVSRTLGLNFALGLDGLSLTMILLSTIVLLAAIWFTGEVAHHEHSFYASLLLMAGGAIGAFASLDLFFFYAFHELALIPTFLLIGIWGTGNRRAAAWKVTIYLAIGSFVLLLGLIMLYQAVPVASRSFDLRVLQQAKISATAQTPIYLLLLAGFGTLISLVPFHTWAPEAYASAPAPAAMLHAGVLKKFGLYGLLRLALPILPEAVHAWAHLLLLLLLGNIIYIGLVTIAQRRLDWMLGYSSVMHMGYIFLGIVSANLLGATGAALLMFAHGLSIALLFALNGEVRKNVPSLNFDSLGGLAKQMPIVAFLFGLAAFAAIGLPGFANFPAEIMVFFGAFRTGFDFDHFHQFQWTTLLALWGVVISAVYLLRAYRRTFFGTAVADRPPVRELPYSLRFPAALLMATSLYFGFFPQALVQKIMPVVRPYFAASR